MRRFLRPLLRLVLLPRTLHGTEQPDLAQKTGGVLSAALLCAGGLWLVLTRSGLAWDWSLIRPYWRLYLDGWQMTVALAGVSLLLSTLWGVALALASRSRVLPVRYSALWAIQLVRSTPFLVQIYILFYVAAEAVQLQNRFVAGVLALSIFSGAYLAEIVRSGIETVGRSQIESAAAIGLTRIQTYRHIILPQALRACLPALAGQLVSLIKDSSLLSVIGLNELTQNARNVASYSFSNFESYLLLAAGYCVLTLPLSWWTARLEARLRYET
jgi:polar amino acid transport system permease protein